jgi:hypothetical protein
MRKRPALLEPGGAGIGDLRLLRHSGVATRKDEQYCRMRRNQSNLEAEWWQCLSGCF